MERPPRLARLLEPRVRPFVYVPVAAGLSFLILLVLPVLSIPVAIFFVFIVPYWMGEKRPRYLFLAALPILMVTALALTGFFTWDLYRPFEPEQQSPDGVLTLGTVSPVFGDADTLFTYRVVFTDAQAPQEAPRVNITSILAPDFHRNETMVLEDATAPDYAAGVAYVHAVRLASDAYQFHFAVLRANGTWTVSTDIASPLQNSRGPVNVAGTALFGPVAISFISFVFLVVGIPLFLVIAIYAVVRYRRARREALLADGEEEPPEAPPP